jgi:peroxiredoxin|tara:strand:- start:539 stop:1033 length:495 start_codon:yes stop_codon:yes gene_type:complete
MIPNVKFFMKGDGKPLIKTSRDIFDNKRVVLFSLPGAFTPICSTKMLPAYENLYLEFKKFGIDEVYCIAVNDCFVMDAWAEDLFISHVKMLPDGNGDFTKGMGMLVAKTNLGYGNRSWRYATVINSGEIEWLSEEPGHRSNTDQDPYEQSKPTKVLDYLKKVAK